VATDPIAGPATAKKETGPQLGWEKAMKERHSTKGASGKNAAKQRAGRIKKSPDKWSKVLGQQKPRKGGGA